MSSGAKRRDRAKYSRQHRGSRQRKAAHGTQLQPLVRRTLTRSRCLWTCRRARPRRRPGPPGRHRAQGRPLPRVRAPRAGKWAGSGPATERGAAKRRRPPGEVKVVFLPKGLRVEHSGKVIVEGALACPYSPDGSTWTLGKDRVMVSLEKAQAGMAWTRLRRCRRRTLTPE